MTRLTAEPQRLVAVPHVKVDLAALDRWSGVEHRVDAVVLRRKRIDFDHRSHGEQLRIRSRHTRLSSHSRRGLHPFAVRGRAERQSRAGHRYRRRLA